MNKYITHLAVIVGLLTSIKTFATEGEMNNSRHALSVVKGLSVIERGNSTVTLRNIETNGDDWFAFRRNLGASDEAFIAGAKALLGEESTVTIGAELSNEEKELFEGMASVSSDMGVPTGVAVGGLVGKITE